MAAAGSRTRTLNRVSAVVAVLVTVVGGWAVVSAYRGDFQDTVTVHVDADRAGLALERGAMVRRNGVRIGQVREVSLTGRGARIDLAIDASAAADVPANTRVEIASTTVFGGKNVDVVDPERPARDALRDGATIAADSVSVEIDTVFSTLTGLLRTVEPEKLNGVLGALATALQGNGTTLRRSVDDLDRVLATVNPRLPALERDLRAGADTAAIYADAGDDLMTALTNLTVTADTVVAERANFDDMLSSLIGLGDRGDAVLAPNADALVQAIVLAEPTATLLRRYSPVLTCFIQGTDIAGEEAKKVSGGNGATMLLNSTLLFGVSAYRYPHHLPRVAATGGPRCGDLPRLTVAQTPAPYVVADTGANPFAGAPPGPRLVPQSILELMLGGMGGGR